MSSDSRETWDINWASRQNFESRTGILKVFCKVGPSSFDTWTKTHQVHCVQGQSWTVWNWWRQFPCSIITMDETWVHHYQPETKEQSKQWKHTSSLTPKKAKVVLSSGKVMASVFWDLQGIILIEYLQKGHTVTGQHYSGQMKRLREVIKEKKPRMLTKGAFFHQDNAPAHTSLVAMATIHDCSPSTTFSRPGPLDFHLFPPIKKSFGWLPFCQWWWRHSCIRVSWVPNKEFFYTGIKALQRC